MASDGAMGNYPTWPYNGLTVELGTSVHMSGLATSRSCGFGSGLPTRSTVVHRHFACNKFRDNPRYFVGLHHTNRHL